MRINRLGLLAALTISTVLFFAVGSATAGHHGSSPTLAGRLLVGDGETAKLSIIDLKKGTVQQDAFDMGARAGRIKATKSGRYALAVSTDADTVHVFDGGIFMKKHGDHFDRVTAPVKQIDVDLSGDYPVHVYTYGKWTPIYYDGSGDIVLFDESELKKQGAAYKPARLNAGPQHGAAVPLAHDLFAVSIQHPKYSTDPEKYRRPIGATITDASGKVLYSKEGCAELHGDGGNGHVAAFGCKGGVLLMKADHGKFDGTFVPLPADADKDYRLPWVWGAPGLDNFFALGTEVGLYVVDAKKGVMKQLIPVSEATRPLQVAVSHDGKALLVVMTDGEVRTYDTRSLELLASASGLLTTPLKTDFWGRPHIATAPGAVFVTDSVGGKVLQLDGKNLKLVKSWKVAGKPTKVAFVGIMGKP